jgi:hypothetical protein
MMNFYPIMIEKCWRRLIQLKPVFAELEKYGFVSVES